MKIACIKVIRLTLITILFLIITLPLFSADNNTGTTTEKTRSIAILEFEGSGVTQDYLKLIKESMEMALYKIPGFQLIEREKIALVISEQEFQMSGLVDDKKVVQIGEILAADIVVTISVNRLTDVVLTAKFLSVQSGKVLYIETATIKKQEDIKAATTRIARGVEKVFYPERFASMKIVLSAGAGCTIPLGDLAEITGIGVHSHVTCSFQDIFINNLDLGIDVQYQYLFRTELSPAEWFQTIPILFSAGYRFTISDFIYIKPSIFGGLFTGIISYDPDGFVMGLEDPQYQVETDLYGESGAGFTAGVILQRFRVELGADFSFIIGDSVPIMMIPVRLSAGWQL